jgi:hypothetical protein
VPKLSLARDGPIAHRRCVVVCPRLAEQQPSSIVSRLSAVVYRISSIVYRENIGYATFAMQSTAVPRRPRKYPKTIFRGRDVQWPSRGRFRACWGSCDAHGGFLPFMHQTTSKSRWRCLIGNSGRSLYESCSSGRQAQAPEGSCSPKVPLPPR